MKLKALNDDGLNARFFFYEIGPKLKAVYDAHEKKFSLYRGDDVKTYCRLKVVAEVSAIKLLDDLKDELTEDEKMDIWARVMEGRD